MTKINESPEQGNAAQKKIEAEQLFRKNMRFFETAIPEIFAKYRLYQPSQVQIILDSNGNLNLANIQTKIEPIYPKDPEIFCKEQVKHYSRNPKFYQIGMYPKYGIGMEQEANAKNSNELLEYLKTVDQGLSLQPLPAQIPFMMVLSVGIGHHIHDLLARCDVKNLCIIEPHEDIFYASLHTLDWQRLAEQFDRDGYTINLIVGKSPADCLKLINAYINQIGLHNAVRSYLFDHLKSDDMAASFSLFLDKLLALAGATGYFDDERLGLAHTVENYGNNIPPLRKYVSLNSQLSGTPVFIIANGPSLDKAKAVIAKHQHQAIIVSCGTALGSLAKMGIKPDFHVEMERTRPVLEWLEASTDGEFREDIILLALNTVHPDVFNLFKRRGMAMKANDLGTQYISGHVKKSRQLADLPFSNPTVGNAGIAFSVALGFRNIYLFGLDLGFSEKGGHHSSLSKHYDIKEEYLSSLNLYQPDGEGSQKLPGNFGGEVKTTQIYSNARLAVEELLRENPDVDCFNTSEGLLIRGAAPLPLEQLKLETPPINNKSLEVQKLFDSHFYSKGLGSLAHRQRIQDSFKPAMEALDEIQKLFERPATSIQDARDKLDKQQKLLFAMSQKRELSHNYHLLKGSATFFGLALSLALSYRSEEDEALEIYNKSTPFYLNYVKDAREIIKNRLLRKDERIRGISEKVKA